MPTVQALDRLQSTLLTSGIQEKNFALYQVISQLIGFLRQTITEVEGAIATGGGGGGGTTTVSTTVIAQLLSENYVEDEVSVPGPTGPAGADGAPGLSAGRIYYPDPSEASDIPTYFVALPVPSTNPETTIAAALTGTGDTLLGAFATEPGQPGVLELPAGTAFRHFHVTTGLALQVARLKVDLYRCEADGSGETLLRSGYSQDFAGTTIQEIIWNFSDGNAYVFTQSQRIVFKVYGARVSGPLTCDLTVYFDGNDNQSFIQTTISVGLTGQQGSPGTPMFGYDGEDGDMFPPIVGPQGNPGSQGETGIPGPPGLGIDGEDGDPAFVLLQPVVSGSGTPEVRYAQVTLTDAQIKTGNTVPVEIVPAQGSGKQILILGCISIKECTAGIYSVTSNLRIRYAGNPTDLIPVQAMFFTSANKAYKISPLQAGGNTTLGLNTAVQVSLSADSTGGNAANYLTVGVAYTVLTDGA